MDVPAVCWGGLRAARRLGPRSAELYCKLGPVVAYGTNSADPRALPAAGGVTAAPGHCNTLYRMRPPVVPDLGAFAIGFDQRDRGRLHELWDQVLTSERWSQGAIVAEFEAAWASWNGLTSVATSSWSGAALAALEFAEVRGETVLCPSNTFMATPLAARAAGAEVVFVDCNRDDLCASFADFEAKALEHRPRAAFLVHIGGHIAFEVERIAEFCRAEGIFLIEDCAHAHGASFLGRRPGSFGDAGIWSFAATKTISTGEGGMLVSRHDDLIEFARAYRDYGKPDYAQPGLNLRMNEFTAALGLVGVERLEEITAWKNAMARDWLDADHPERVELPDGMTSGLYKYIVFRPIERSTGKVYDMPCHRIMGHAVDLPNSDWVAENHWCVPLYYRPSPHEGAEEGTDV
ncbi:MAG: perosamine synthetase [Gaiellales bacterium]|nr:perosamine synthetase [Gaiellales bacterium]